MQDIDNRDPTPVTFRFQNIGPVKDANLELGDLTVIAGRNNTGKTYIVYTLYGFLKMWEGWPDADEFMMRQRDDRFPDISAITRDVHRNGQATIPLDSETLNKQRISLIQEIAKAFSTSGLPAVFSSRRGDFETSSIEVELAARTVTQIHPPHYRRPQHHDSLSIDYDGTSLVVTLRKAPKRPTISDLHYNLVHEYLLFLLRDYLPEPFILSAERFGISLFYRELDFTKNQLVDLLQRLGDDKNRERISPFIFIDRATSRYALPIKDNIDYTRSIPDLRGKGALHDYKLFDDIKDMMDGYYGNSSDDIRFISKARGKRRSFNIPLHLASSSVRCLSDLYFFLRHIAETNRLLIIDEPESHLDTANQVLLARLLARVVRAGLKVLVTTHSDYLIKEINNLVMLSQPFTDKATVMEKFKYGPDDFLPPSSIRAYVAENNGLSRCEVDNFGVNMAVFDSTIDKINKTANELSARLSEDSEA